MKNICLLLTVSSLLFSQQATQLFNDTARPSEEWLKNGIIYEINTRAFSKKGNFAGIEEKFPELKRLGVTILWLMPIHPVGEEKRKGSLGSPYSVRDYYGINPEFGDINDFKRLVKKSHEFGFKIIIDLVANHTSWDSKMFKEHPEWFTKNSDGKFISPVVDWYDVVDLNYNNKELRRYMIEMLKYWVHDVDLDGFRCDVAEMVPTDFWNEVRASLDSIKPVMMLSEGQYPEHHLKAFDLTYSWNMYGTLAKVLKRELPASEFDSVLAREALAYPKGSIRLRFSSNHDENAWDKPDVEKFGIDGALLAAVLVNTYPGVPLIYNGQEVANNVKLELFEKLEIDWTKGQKFREFYTKLYSIRKKNRSLAVGEYKSIRNNRSDRAYTFIRTDGKNTVLAAFNFSDSKTIIQLEPSKIFSSLKFIDAFTRKQVAKKNFEKIELPKFGYRLFVAE